MTPEPLPPYRVMTKLQALVLIGAIVAVGAVVVWLGTAWIERYLEQMDMRRQSNPRAAIAAMVTHLKILAVIQFLPLTAFSAFMIWYCRRAIESQSLPPVGAWIVEGQRIHLGPGAVRNARILLALTGLITLVGAIAAVYVYCIALSLQEQATGA